jgi:hypothetical protein
MIHQKELRQGSTRRQNLDAACNERINYFNQRSRSQDDRGQNQFSIDEIGNRIENKTTTIRPFLRTNH